MTPIREKFRKAYEEQERAEATFAKANADGSVTKNEVAKLQMQASKTSQACDAAKGKYASQLVKTNEFQSKYYRELLPRVLEGLESLEKERVTTVQSAFMRVVSKEKEVQPIICRCHEAIEAQMKSISPDEDALVVVERFKSGDVPPGDFKFEDMRDPQVILCFFNGTGVVFINVFLFNKAMLAQDALEKPTNLNLYPKKRELERAIQETEAALARKRKELASLEQMVATYKSNPKFGNTKHFQV